MFDIGFWELAVIGVIALLVIGPERLPGLARTTGLWMGKARRFLATVKADIDQELRAEELKRIMKEHAESAGVHEIIEETRSTAAELKATTDELNQPVIEERHPEPSSPSIEDKSAADPVEAEAAPREQVPVETRNDR